MIRKLFVSGNAKKLIGGISFWKWWHMKSRIFKSLPSLVAIQSFVVCAELKSINKASMLLHKSQGAISKQVKQLEAHYGVILFERSVEGLKLTEQGVRFLAVSQGLLDLIEGYEFREQYLLRPIVISAPSTFTLRWLLPRLESINSEFGDQKLKINSTHQDLTSVNESELEVIIRRDNTLAKGLVSTELFPEFLTPMCSRAVMARIVKNGLSLQDQTLLHASKSGGEWATWLECSKTKTDVSVQSIVFDTLDLAMSAAEASMGIVIGDPVMAADRLEKKRLVMPFSLIVPSGKKYHACYSEKYSDNPAIVKLINLLKDLV